jgi:tRNA-splicing ligase RtcB
MSYKYSAQKVSENHYVLPRVGSMLVECHAFLSESLYESSDESTWAQIANGASYEGVVGAYLMPDCHSGFGVPIGSVLVTEGTLIQCGSGYDISCGVLYLKVPELTASDVVDSSVRSQWVKEVEKRVALGIGSSRPCLMTKYSDKKVDEVLRYGAKALGIHSDLFERQFLPVPEDLDLKKIGRAYEKAPSQLGSLGSGNHFCELQAGLDGSVWVMIHTGSRGYGWQTAEHFFYEGAKLRGIPTNRREESWLGLSESLGQEYWAYHNSAANYAIANRYAIALSVQEALGEVFGTQGKLYYDISHNLIQEETLVLPDGSHKKGLVHRKGATRAFPAEHPDLIGTGWEKTGHPILIPGSMYDGAAILFPHQGAYKSACSVNHGSGRLMGRGEAKRQLTSLQEDIDLEMSSVIRTFGGVSIKGIISNSEHTPLDECTHVYKSLGAVLEVLTEENIAHIEHRMYPIANIKGLD